MIDELSKDLANIEVFFNVHTKLEELENINIQNEFASLLENFEIDYSFVPDDIRILHKEKIQNIFDKKRIT